MNAKNSICSLILLDKNISLLTSSYKKLNHFFKILFELDLVSPISFVRKSHMTSKLCRRNHLYGGGVASMVVTALYSVCTQYIRTIMGFLA